MNIVKQKCKERKIKLKDLAKHCECSYSHFIAVVAGKRSLSLKLLLRISENTNISTEELINFYNKKQGVKNGKL